MQADRRVLQCFRVARFLRARTVDGHDGEVVADWRFELEPASTGATTPPSKRGRSRR